MSVAGPVVPVKEDGEVDQDRSNQLFRFTLFPFPKLTHHSLCLIRLVALLAGLGQQGGMLKLFGKVAMLWGGIRGAMSLTDRLILFLRLAERPLLQR